jgi:hypothetical protein
VANSCRHKKTKGMATKFFQLMDEVFILLIALSGEEL